MDPNDENLNGGGTGGQGNNNNNPPPPPAGTGGQNGNGGASDDSADFTSLEEANKAIKALRKENATRRTANKSLEDSVSALTEKLGKVSKHLGLEDEAADPEEVIRGLQDTSAKLEMELAITQMARANNISVEHDDYFKFLVQKRIAEFEESAQEGDELPEDFFQKVAEEVSQYGGNGTRRGSLGANGGNKPPVKPNNNSDVTAEKLAQMSMSEKVAFRQKDPETYKRLWNEAVSKRLIK